MHLRRVTNDHFAPVDYPVELWPFLLMGQCIEFLLGYRNIDRFEKRTGDDRYFCRWFVDLYGVTVAVLIAPGERQAELVEISSGVQGVPPFLARYTIDTHHTPGYGAGYVANLVQPRLFMTTHMPFDPYLNEESVVEVREHWKGPFHFGAPDGIVVNVTKEQIWVREGIIPDFPNSRAPQFDFSNGQLVVPKPPHQRVDIQEPYVRDMEIDPKEYYPEGYHPELMKEWPVDKDLVVPLESLPDNLKDSMGAAWRLREKNNKVLEAQ